MACWPFSPGSRLVSQRSAGGNPTQDLVMAFLLQACGRNATLAIQRRRQPCAGACDGRLAFLLRIRIAGNSIAQDLVMIFLFHARRIA